MNFTQTKRAFFIVWLILSTIFLASSVALSFLSTEEIYKLTPTCEWKAKYDRECFFCGMTTGFIQISLGNFSEAHDSNFLSIPLFSALLLNEILFLFFLVWQIRKHIKINQVNDKLNRNKNLTAQYSLHRLTINQNFNQAEPHCVGSDLSNTGGFHADT